MTTAPFSALARPKVSLFGENNAVALLHMLGALEEAIAQRMADRADLPAPIDMRDVPKDSLFGPLPLLTSLKVQLYRLLRERGIPRANLARSLNWHREQMDRLFRLDHNSRLDQIEAAAKAAGAKIDARIREDACVIRQTLVAELKPMLPRNLILAFRALRN